MDCILISENDCVPLYVPGTCCPVYTCTNSVTSLLTKDGNEEADRKQSKGG